MRDKRSTKRRPVLKMTTDARLFSWPQFIRRAPQSEREQQWLLEHEPKRRATTPAGELTREPAQEQP